jgi:hypothetical protein
MTDRMTHKMTDGQIESHTGRNGQTERWTDGQRDEQTDGQTVRWPDR